MSDTTPHGPDVSSSDTASSPFETDRYAHLSLEDGAIVIYDRERPDTWLQSDVVVDIGA